MIKISPYVFPGLGAYNYLYKESKPESILDIACKCYSISKEEICQMDRQRHIVTVRNACFFTLNKLLYVPSTKAGKMIGNRDHSTVINAVKSHLNIVTTDDIERNRFNMFLRNIGTQMVERFERDYPKITR